MDLFLFLTSLTFSFLICVQGYPLADKLVVLALGFGIKSVDLARIQSWEDHGAVVFSCNNVSIAKTHARHQMHLVCDFNNVRSFEGVLESIRQQIGCLPDIIFLDYYNLPPTYYREGYGLKWAKHIWFALNENQNEEVIHLMYDYIVFKMFNPIYDLNYHDYVRACRRS